MHVPLLDLTTQYQALRDEIQPAIEAVLDSQYLINGPAVGELECDIAGYCGTPFAIGVSSGTDALICTLMAIDIQPGDEVICPSFTFFATAGSIWRVGAKPVFVDIEPGTFNIDTAQLESKITNKTKAIMPVHLFGQLAEMPPILEIAKRHDLFVIEDAAQAIGAKQGDQRAGSLGHVGCFSFYPTKNLGGAGDGGMVVTHDETLAQQMIKLRNHGTERRYFHQQVGGNFRLDTLQAVYLLKKLPHLEGWHTARRQHAAHYDHLLADIEQVITPTVLPNNTCIYNQYVIRAQQRDELQAYLGEHNIGSGIYYPLGLHEQACFASLGYQHGDLPETERATQEVLALPIHPELTEAQVAYVAQTITRFYNG